MEQTIVRKKNVGWMITAVSLMLFSVCLVVSLAFALGNNGRAQDAVERGYERNLYDLGDNLSNLEVNLSKLMIAPDGKYATVLLTDVYSEALAANKSLSMLPIDGHAAEDASGFLNQVADFAISYQNCIASGKSGRSFAGSVESMYNTAKKLNEEIADSVSLVSENKMNIRKVTSEKPYSFRSSDKISHTPVQYPELIYDGPFSDGRDVEEYRYFENEPAISLKDAKEIAKAALPDLGVKTVTSAGKSEKEPLYELMISGERGDAYVSVSERGGKIINLSVWRDLGANMLGENNAKACAKDFANRLGYDVEPVWYLASGGVAYINLAPVINDVIMYTDLVKVKVALDNGEALGLEAKNYCLNHCKERNTSLTMNRAAVPTLVDDRLDIVSVRGALIPLENGEERLCYEAAAKYNDLYYFVYLDAVNGETVKIMRTVDSAQGNLVM